MPEKPQECCPDCGEPKKVRRWSTHWRTKNKIHPIRRMAVAFCVTPGCPRGGGAKQQE